MKTSFFCLIFYCLLNFIHQLKIEGYSENYETKTWTVQQEPKLMVWEDQICDIIFAVSNCVIFVERSVRRLRENWTE